MNLLLFGAVITIVLIKNIKNEETSITKDTVEIFIVNNKTSNESAKIAESNDSSLVQVERIVQPTELKLRQIDIDSTVIPQTNVSGQEQNKNFKPSPQLETYFEYNKFPVVPAFPEAKHFSAYSGNRANAMPWSLSPWDSKIRFPTQATPVITSKDYPYSYQTNELPGKNFGYNYPIPTIERDINAFRHPQSFQNSAGKIHPGFVTSQNGPAGVATTVTSNSFFDPTPTANYFENFFQSDKTSFPGWHNKGPQKTNFDFTSLSDKTAPITAWKKFVKILTAFIPIGLLIGALTPSVVTISNGNASRSRGRAEDDANYSSNRLVSSFNFVKGLKTEGCEERVLCELLLSAGSSSNAQQHVENFLDTFVERERDGADKAEDLKKIIDSVKSGDCRSLPCENIKNAGRT